MTYVLEITTADLELLDDELVQYLLRLAIQVDDVVVADGSSPRTVELHRLAMGPRVRVVADAHVSVALQRACHDHVVIAGDDMRFTGSQLARIDTRLGDADVVWPQHHFRPLPFHARLETAGILLARTFGRGRSSAAAMRRRVLPAPGGGGDTPSDVAATLHALHDAGVREHIAFDVIVERRPPALRAFVRERIRPPREDARPRSAVATLAIAPLTMAALTRRRGRRIAAAAVACSVAVAELGRQRSGGRACYPASSSLLAPVWIVAQSLLAWTARARRRRAPMPPKAVVTRRDRVHAAVASRC